MLEPVLGGCTVCRGATRFSGHPRLGAAETGATHFRDKTLDLLGITRGIAIAIVDQGVAGVVLPDIGDDRLDTGTAAQTGLEGIAL